MDPPMPELWAPVAASRLKKSRPNSTYKAKIVRNAAAASRLRPE
jgi:hypothetical protein